MLSLLLACGFVPPGGDSDTDPEPGTSAGELDDDGPGSGGTLSTTSSGNSASGDGSFTGVDPTNGTDDEGGSEGGDTGEPDTGEDDEGEESSGTGGPGEPCEALQLACATFDGSELILFGLDSGAVLDSFLVPFSAMDSHSITWLDDHVYACGGASSTLHRVDVTTGLATDSGLVCSGVSEVDGALLVRRGSIADITATDYAIYDDFAAATADLPSVVTDYPPNLERMTASGDQLLTTWHSTDHFERWDVPTSAPLGDVFFEGHDGWVMGMDVVQGQVIIGTWFSDPLRHIAFDLETGTRTCEYASAGQGDPLNFTTGLACHRTLDEPPPPPPPPPA